MTFVAWPIIIALLLLAFAIYMMVDAARAIRWVLTDFRRDIVPLFPASWQRAPLFRISTAIMPIWSVLALALWASIAFDQLCQICKASMVIA